MKSTAIAFTVLAASFAAGCAAIPATPAGARVELVNDSPNRTQCKYLGEVVGSQGNWFTGGHTSDRNLVIGSRNELRNQAAELGANTVHVQDSKLSGSWGSSGGSSSTVVGKAYKCIG